jgi:hypothetical protein
VDLLSRCASALFGLGHGADLVAVLEVHQPDALGSAAEIPKGSQDGIKPGNIILAVATFWMLGRKL